MGTDGKRKVLNSRKRRKRRGKNFNSESRGDGEEVSQRGEAATELIKLNELNENQSVSEFARRLRTMWTVVVQKATKGTEKG